MSKTSVIPDLPALLVQIAHGNEAAFATLFDHFKDDLYYLTFSLTKSAAIAEDVLQEVFLRIWMRRAELPAIDNFRGYLVVVVKNTVLNEFRKQNRLRNREGQFSKTAVTVAYNDAIDRLSTRQYDSLLQQALQLLPAQQATVFRMIKLDGLSRQEVASQLGLSPETIKKHLERAMKAVRAFMLVHLDDTVLLLLMAVSGFF